MTEHGSVLLADDEEIFRESTADLLRHAGLRCDTARDGSDATALLAADDYDVVVADIRMPGNVDLGFLERTPSLRDVPVILVTAYPSLDTAIHAVDLSVVGYLVKPVDFDQLLLRIRAAIAGTSLRRTVRRAGEGLRASEAQLGHLRQALERSRREPTGPAVDLFVAAASQNILDSLADLRSLARALTGAHHQGAEPCHLLNCPRLRRLEAAVATAVEVLEQTKTTFKSRQLGDLRRSLEEALREVCPRVA